MKKLFVLSLALLLLLSGCGASAAASGGAAEPTAAAAAEPTIQAAETAQILDLTGMSSTILLAQLTAMQNGPEEYLGKTVRMQGTFLVGTFTALTGNSSLGVMSIAVLFVIGFVMMLKVPAREEEAE